MYIYFCYLFSGEIRVSTATPPLFLKKGFIQVRHRGLNSFAFSPLITILQFDEMERTNVSTYLLTGEIF